MLNNRFSNTILVVFLLVFSLNAVANSKHVSIKLLKIEAAKTSERSGDEIYFSIISYPNKAEPTIARVPMFPLHWKSKDLKTVTNVMLWEGDLNPGQSTLLVLSLLEQDLPPFNSDDHIGSVQVILKNDNGKLIAKWGQAHYIDQPKVQQPDIKIPKFIMFGNKSKYVTVFQVDSK
jgi:hypothetical protein